MSKLICNVCGKETIVGEGSLRYRAYFCKGCDTITDHVLNGMEPTLFDRITQSPEVLAEKLVVEYRHGVKDYAYYSTVTGGLYNTKAEAIAATVEKLKEVEKCK